MDKVRSYIRENIEFYRQPDQYSLLDRMSKHGGLFWAEDGLEPWERMVEWPELELLSAFEFLRPELPPEQVEILDWWIAKYAEWREQGVFYKWYQESWGDRFTWEQERLDAEEELGRLIPHSHWWFWPPEKDRKK
jgi:hypothetical protein